MPVGLIYPEDPSKRLTRLLNALGTNGIETLGGLSLLSREGADFVRNLHNSTLSSAHQVLRDAYQTP